MGRRARLGGVHDQPLVGILQVKDLAVIGWYWRVPSVGGSCRAVRLDVTDEASVHAAEVVVHPATLPADGPTGTLWGDLWPEAEGEGELPW